MARKSKVEKEPEPKPDLTPMIDIVFNLIIFFMIVSELSNLDVEQIELPFADNAQDPKSEVLDVNDKVLQINVVQSGLIKIRGAAYTMEPELKDRYPWLTDFLEIEAAGYEREEPEAPGAKPPSKLRVNIRADAFAQFKYVQQVFDACVNNGIYKTSLAATKDEPK
jgi:biopolymer transport protein ExbD